MKGLIVLLCALVLVGCAAAHQTVMAEENLYLEVAPTSPSPPPPPPPPDPEWAPEGAVLELYVDNVQQDPTADPVLTMGQHIVIREYVNGGLISWVNVTDSAEGSQEVREGSRLVLPPKASSVPYDETHALVFGVIEELRVHPWLKLEAAYQRGELSPDLQKVLIFWLQDQAECELGRNWVCPFGEPTAAGVGPVFRWIVAQLAELGVETRIPADLYDLEPLWDTTPAPPPVKPTDFGPQP
jgi:hypothetical protein